MTASEPPAPPATRSSILLLITCSAAFLELLDASIVNVALFSIREELALGDIALQWVLNAYLLTFGGFLLLGGRAADLFGTRRMLLIGLSLFVAASALGGAALNGVWLTVARAVQGVGVAIIAPATLAIIVTHFRSSDQRAKAIGLWTASGVAGAALGSLIGGVLTELLSWRWVLWINVPVGLVLVAGVLIALQESSRRPRRSFDVAGALTITTGLLSLLLATVSVVENGLTSPVTITAFGVAVVLIAVFVVVERRAADPIVPLPMLRRRSVATGNLIVMLANGGSLALYYLIALLLQEVLGFDPLQAGLAFLPISFGIMVGSFAGSSLIPRYSPALVMAGAAVVAALAVAWLGLLPTDASYLGDVLVPTLVMGVGIGAVFVPSFVVATHGANNEDSGIASGLVNTSNQFGGAIGVAVLATLAAAYTEPLVGYTRAMFAAAGLLVVTALAALWVPRDAAGSSDAVAEASPLKPDAAA